MALSAAAPPSNLPQSSIGRFEGHQRTGAPVAEHDEFEQFFAGGQALLAHAKAVKDVLFLRPNLVRLPSPAPMRHSFVPGVPLRCHRVGDHANTSEGD